MPANRGSRSASHCQFPFSDGRRCALPLSPNHPSFCLTHALRERRLLGTEQIAAELAAMSTRIRTASDLNHFLTRLVFYTASKRIPKSTARTLAYLASLLLQTLPSVKNEVTIAHGYQEWRELLRQTVPDVCGESEPAVEPPPTHQPSEEDFPDPAIARACPQPRKVGSKPAHFPHNASATNRDHTRQPDELHSSDFAPDNQPVAVSG